MADTTEEPSTDRVFPGGRPTTVVLALLATAAAVLLFTLVDPWSPRVGMLVGGADLDVYRDGARHVMEDLPLYTEPVIHGLLYTYTPFSTLMFLPFGLLPGGIDKYLWMGFNLVLLVAIVALCWRMLGYLVSRRVVVVSVLLAVACTFLEPVRTTLFYGQINLVLMALVLWDVSRADGSRIKGVGVGIAAGIKLTPAYFVLYYLVLRKWRAAAVAAAAFVATIVGSWLVLPQDSRQYWTETFFDSTRIADDSHPANQSLRGALTRLAGEPVPTWVWLLVAAAVVAVSMWVVVRLHRGGERLLAVTVAGLTAAVVSPFTWSHHWVWFVPLAVYLVHRALTNTWWWAGVVALFGIAGSWAYRFPDDTIVVGLYLFPPHWVAWDIVVNMYVLLYTAVLIGAGVVAFRAGTPTPPHRTLPDDVAPDIEATPADPDRVF
ncbi:glycosyltransferase 87 family protein [Prescottella defluvii]|uniref:glycosyltransferase 87 family protein n=1 Tax=Prescottella defluvii TaxID=1323361 RepID=UPI0009DF5878|nr:glycosyltransferase 87 family protein [Prescottella defluvii]